MNTTERKQKDTQTSQNYYKLIEEWKPFEEYISIKDQKKLANCLNNSQKLQQTDRKPNDQSIDSTINSTSTTETQTTKSVFKNTNKPSTIKTSLFGFSLLKQKSKPLVTTPPVISEESMLSLGQNGENEDKNEYPRKDSSLSNDVFIEYDSSFSFSLSKFSAKSLFNKLMQRNLEDADTNSINSANTILNEEVDESKDKNPSANNSSNCENQVNFSLNEENSIDQSEHIKDAEYKEIARQIVDNVLNKVLVSFSEENSQSLESQGKCVNSNSNTTVYEDGCESIKSGSIYIDTRNVLSNTASSISVDDVYHDVETDHDHDFDTKTIEKQPSVEISERKLSNSLALLSKQCSIKKSLSNQELIESFALNMHRIDKDVTRCDRNYWYFTSNENLKKLKNIMYT